MSKEGGNAESPQGGDPSKKDPNADLYENRGTKKIIRLVTVMAYMFSVSFVAIVLSAYYLFLWEPPNPKLLRRPVHLSSEPEVQFLQADMSDLQNDASMKNFLSEITTGQKGSNNSYKSLAGRIVGDENNLLDEHYSGKKHRRTLNESLALLRNSLVEFMRNRINRSKVDEEFSEKEGRLNSTNRDEKKMEFGTRSKNLTEDTGFSNVTNRPFGNNTAFLTPSSSTIPGDEVNNDRFTSNGSLSKNALRSMVNKIVAREQSRRSVLKGIGRENSSESLPKVEASANSNEGFINIRRTATINEPDVVASMKGKDSGIRENGEEQFVTVKFDGSLRHLRRSSGESTGVATNLKETQIERMTMKSTTVGLERTDSPETVTAQRQKDLSTILTEINATSSTVSQFPTVGDLSTDSNAKSKEMSTEKQSKVT